MEDKSVAVRLEEWAGDRQGAQELLAKRVANVLTKKIGTTTWSFLNLREEFEVRNSQPTRRDSVASFLLPILYLLPIFITWLHMWIALNAFKDLTRSDNIGPFDFITFWTSGYERHRPPATLQDAALQVIIALTGIAAAQWLLRKSGVEIGISSELHDLIMDAQLEISKLKAVTPQEMADSLTEASRSLETALARTGSSMDSIGAFSKELSTVTTGLQAVTQSLDQSATRVERAVEPLMALPHILSQTVTSVAGITERLSEARAQMDSTSDNAYRLAEITYELINKTSGVLNELDAVTRRINIAGETSDRFITTMSAAAEISKELADVVDNYSPHILALREIAEKFRMTTNSLDVISQSFEASANLYKNTNETQPKGD